ncbi:DUF3619 family protein [Cupriavidus gilardii]|uniref:DUF3619 family protein n=1 Tax=Cupriavidus gilardii TaxID=82541 RepID=UPI001573841A|nr:DUF3619 family protein [Cupriavidus gilardii]MCG5259999.1 DUF3619 family protein [Cupriavidus gilardii]MDF9430896.1 DUF3619 family protein [Cupriavidus gilardii]NSX05949.1 DUF3619 family protein [Cupriavidus gilardii]
MNSRNASEIEQRRLARQITAMLDASANQVPDDIAARLAAARRVALSRRRVEAPQTSPRLVAAGPSLHGDARRTLRPLGDWVRRLGLVWTLVALAGGLAGIYQWQQQQRIEELADVDAAMLLDELPPAAYADEGFHVFLKHGE